MNPYVEIFNHFGQETQFKKLIEEVHEFIEAVEEGDEEHAHEELADVLTVLRQFMYAKNFDMAKTMNYEQQKVLRTLNRIESGYYKGEE